MTAQKISDSMMKFDASARASVAFVSPRMNRQTCTRKAYLITTAMLLATSCMRRLPRQCRLSTG